MKLATPLDRLSERAGFPHHVYFLDPARVDQVAFVLRDEFGAARVVDNRRAKTGTLRR